ncbi:MAG: hypothetical protein U1F29_11370 [Planctomycetota bacterium]
MRSPVKSTTVAVPSVLVLLALASCRSDGASAAASPASSGSAARPPLPVVSNADALIEKGETHFAHLWRLTKGVDNAAEGYWSFDGRAITMQATPNGAQCDRIYALGVGGNDARLISNEHGVTTCSYFLPDGKSILYASTHAWAMDCPPKPDMSKGYVWPVHPEYDIYVHDLATGKERALTTTYGYDAEATISPLGDRMVFTSTRSGDLELWTSDLDGNHLQQVTNAPGYDGGAFFSHDGKWLVFRATAFTPGKEQEEIAQYRGLLSNWLVKPTKMEIMLVRPDGSERKQVTHLGRANFAPFFFPDDRRIVFASNHHDSSREGRKFDLFACDLDGKDLERLTTYDGFDAFPMFSPDGKWFVFASNRGGATPEETNLYVAEWR